MSCKLLLLSTTGMPLVTMKYLILFNLILTMCCAYKIDYDGIRLAVYIESYCRDPTKVWWVFFQSGKWLGSIASDYPNEISLNQTYGKFNVYVEYWGYGDVKVQDSYLPQIEVGEGCVSMVSITSNTSDCKSMEWYPIIDASCNQSNNKNVV